MFGNELTEEQRQTSLMTALGITGIAGAAKAVDKMANGTKLIPYSKEYVQNQVQKAQDSIKDMGKAIGKVEVPTGVKVRTVADTTGNTYKAIRLDKTPIKDLAQKITAKGEGSKGSLLPVKGPQEIIKVKYGQHYTRDKMKKVLKPNIEYTSPGGHVYKTDEKGRISSVEGSLDLGSGKRNKYAQRIAGREDRLPDDQGGHLIASIFKGSGQLDNLVPMNANLNMGEWKKLESSWAKALDSNPPKTVEVKIYPVYEGNSIRPTSFDIEYKVDNGRWEIREFENKPGG
ncbi:DNA/RNA non-specific endonuclease [Peribacillus sp. NPDC097295]|uniref:DNA/RNA non-specific endonuclease n=1 Tax=Peribacillus sp. NPDC097295 TaxID=3364402 RepID=UPI003813AF30